METAIPTVYESLSGNQELNASREPATIDPKMLGVSVFKVVSETLYPRHQYNMSESTQISLYAYNKQATIGPNLESAPNCLFAFFSPPLSNVKWQTWRCLGNMPKAKAMKNFMEIYFDQDPDFQDALTTTNRTTMDELRAQMINCIVALGLKRRTDKFLYLYSKIGRAVLKIQTAARMFIAKKKFMKKHTALLQSEVGWLVDVLKLGIRVTKVAYNGGIPRSRFVWLEGDFYNLGSARLCVAAKMVKGAPKSKGMYVSDIAEIRPNSSSYTFKLSGVKLDDSECLSIIGTERTIDLMFYKGEMYGKSRDWLVRTLNILVDKSIPPKELSSRGRIQGQRVTGIIPRMSAGSLRDGEHMGVLLQRGFGVKEYIEGKGISATTMWTIPLRRKGDLRLVLSSSSPSINSKGINISDISEVRFGKVSYAHDLDYPGREKMVSIVGSETCLHCIFDDEVLRVKFVTRMQCFLQKMRG